MKLKLRLDQKSIQEFFLHNVEKIGLGIAVLLFLLLAYSALTRVERYQKTPEQLIQASKDGQRRIEETQPESLTLSDYVVLAQRSREPTSETAYSNRIAWTSPLFPKKDLRPEPAVFTVEQLQGTAEKGAFSEGGTAGGIRGKRWVVLTALVPVERQDQAYAEAFKTSVSYDPAKDHPEYRGYWVQRLEVSSPGEAADPNWEKAETRLSVREVEEALTAWGSGNRSEMVAKEYIQEPLVFPLGPLAGRSWDTSVAHLPQIPLEKPDEALGRKGPDHREEKPPEKPRTGDSDDPFGTRGRDPAGGPEVPSMGDRIAQENRAPSYLLFRFFDFKAEPGKHYIYRVRLGLENPNYGKKESLLKDPKLGKLSYLATKWSDPSPVIAVPGDTRIFAFEVKPGRTSAETQGSVAVAKWLESEGRESIAKATVSRGQLAIADEKEASEGAKPDITTAPIAIDFRGGQKLTAAKNSLLSSGEVLLVNPDGILIVRNELDDRPTYDKLVNEEKEPIMPGPGAMPGPGGIAPPGARPGAAMPGAGPAPPGATRPGGAPMPDPRAGAPARGALEGIDAGGARRKPTRPSRAP